MRIIVDGYLPSEWKKDLKQKIKDKEIRTWKFIKEGDHERLLHIGDEQYADVVIRLIAPKEKEQLQGVKFTHFVPTVLETIKEKEAIKIAEQHLEIVLGRFAEVLNCHYLDAIKDYRTIS